MKKKHVGTIGLQPGGLYSMCGHLLFSVSGFGLIRCVTFTSPICFVGCFMVTAVLLQYVGHHSFHSSSLSAGWFVYLNWVHFLSVSPA